MSRLPRISARASVNRAEALTRAEGAKFARMATVRPDGAPHIVVVTFVLTGAEFVTAVDHKPKSTRRLQRIRNVEVNPQVSVLIDHVSEDWTELWWVRLDGRARLQNEVPPSASRALAAKYPQYREHPPEGPAINVEIEDVRSWEF